MEVNTSRKAGKKSRSINVVFCVRKEASWLFSVVYKKFLFNNSEKKLKKAGIQSNILKHRNLWLENYEKQRN